MSWCSPWGAGDCWRAARHGCASIVRTRGSSESNRRERRTWPLHSPPGAPVDLPEIDTFVDGAAVRRAGDVTFPLIRDAEVELVTVPEGQICTEMLDLYQIDGVITEPAGALASAALTGEAVSIFPGQAVVCVLSGGNNDVSRYAEVVERSLVHRGLKHYFLIEFPQEPGALRRFLDEVLGPDDD